MVVFTILSFACACVEYACILCRACRVLGTAGTQGSVSTSDVAEECTPVAA